MHKKLGYNFRMTNLQAAVALAQTERLEEFLEKREKIETWYNERLRTADLNGILVMPKRDVLWMYDILAHDRENLIKYLDKNGIETRVFFKPMSRQPMYFDKDYANLRAHQLSERGLYLPTYTKLEEKDVDSITKKIKEFYKI